MFATVVSEKGVNDDLAIKQLGIFFKENGVRNMVYKSDQENSLKACIDEAVRSVGGTATEDDDAVLCAVPEYSAVGESASNGKAERSVQQLEDQVRTLKSALEERIGARLGSTHSVMRWLVRHCSSILTRFAVNPDGRTPYQVTHGKRAVDKLVEFGERVYYYVPKRARFKLDLRWRLGVCLGIANNSNEYYVGLYNGNVVKARYVVRVVASKR